MNEMLNLSNVNLANVLQQKDQEIVEETQVDKEQELSNLKQRYTYCKIQIENQVFCALVPADPEPV